MERLPIEQKLDNDVLTLSSYFFTFAKVSGRFIIWILVCFCAYFFVGTNKTNGVHVHDALLGATQSNTYHFAQKNVAPKHVVKKQKQTVFKKPGYRIRIWTKMFPFVLPDRVEIENAFVSGFNIFSACYLSSKCGYDESWHSYRGPPVSCM